MKKFRWLLVFFLAVCCVSCQSTAGTAPTAEAVPAASATVPPTEVAQPAPAVTVEPVSTEMPAEAVLTLKALDGTSQDFTLEELKNLPAVEGQAGIKSSTGKITVPALFKGVLLTELLEQVGGADSTMGIEIEAKDGYAMTFSADQVISGDFIAYDPATGDEIEPDGPLQVLVAYEMEGQPLDVDRDGVLRLVVISEKNDQVTDGHWSIKWVRNITIKQLAQEWDLVLEGGIEDSLDRGSFESCSTGQCHPAVWQDEKAQVWSGTPLWLVVGHMDDEIKHGDNSFNYELAENGYSVEVIGRDGYSTVFDIARLVGNNDIILAHQVNDNPLTEENFPLRLVGADVQKKEAVGGIEKIILHLDEQPTPVPTEAPTQAPVSTGPVVLPEDKAFMSAGLVESELAWSLDELRALEPVQLTVEHPKKGQQDVEGVRINTLLDLVKVQPEGKQVTFTAADGFTATVDLQAVRDCNDCLVAFDESGTLKLVMPGMESSFWVKDVIALTVQ